MGGRKGDLKIEAAGVSVHIDNLAGKIQPRDEFGLHGFWVNFPRVDTAACDNGFGNRPKALHGNRQMLEKSDQPFSFFFCDGMDLFSRVDSG